MDKKLYKISSEGKLTGVAAGLAEYANLDVTLVRVLLIVGAFLTDGLLLIAYIILAFVLPDKDNQKKQTVSTEAMKPSDYPRKDAEVDNSPEYNLKNWFGLGLIGIGIWMLGYQLLPEINIWKESWEYIWPALLVILGVVLLMKRSK